MIFIKWEIIVKYNGDLKQALSHIQNIEIEILSENYAIISIERDKIGELYNYPEVIYIENPKVLTYSANNSSSNFSNNSSSNNSSKSDGFIEGMNAVCIPQAQSGTYGYDLNGGGVLLAVIDSGIDYTHPDFRNEDGSTRILYIWDQSNNINQNENQEYKSPEDFNFGIEYTAEDLNKALKSKRPYEIIENIDYNGHGTAVAGIAAGNGRGGQKGAASGAFILAVKLGTKGRESFAQTTSLMRAIKYATDKAIYLKMPLVINISYSTNDGSHDGNSLFENYIDEMSEKWKTCVVVASGNDGDAGHHYYGKLKSNETREIDMFVSTPRTSFYITLWKNFCDDLSFEIVAPNGKSTGKINYTNRTHISRIGAAQIYISYDQPNHYTENQNVYFEIAAENPTVFEGLWKMRVYSAEVIYGNFNIWLPTVEDVSRETKFVTPSSDFTLGLPSTTPSVITVGGYNHRTEGVASFSGRGELFNRENSSSINNIKPDIVAPCLYIPAPKPGGGYDLFTGTSAAAPFVSGACALIMQWGIINKNDYYLYGQRVKAFLHAGANRQSNSDIVYPNNTWGYGSLCLKSTLDYLQKYAKYYKSPAEAVETRSVDAPF